MELLKRTEVAHFDTVSEEYRTEYERNTPEGHSFRIRREKVLALLPEGTGKHALDLASGPGVMIRGLRAKGYRVTCVDASPEMVALAKKEAGDDGEVSCIVGDAYALPFGADSFDVATAMGLIEYLDDEERFLAELARVTMQGGTVIITFPNMWSPWRLWNRALRALARPSRGERKDKLLHREYTPARAKKLLEKRFAVDAIRYYNVKLVPFPFDRLFPAGVARLSRLSEWLAKTPLGWLGTGFILRAVKH